MGLEVKQAHRKEFCFDIFLILVKFQLLEMYLVARTGRAQICVGL